MPTFVCCCCNRLTQAKSAPTNHCKLDKARIVECYYSVMVNVKSAAKSEPVVGIYQLCKYNFIGCACSDTQQNLMLKKASMQNCCFTDIWVHSPDFNSGKDCPIYLDSQWSCVSSVNFTIDHWQQGKVVATEHYRAYFSEASSIAAPFRSRECSEP